jgi:hypothetical protein
MMPGNALATDSPSSSFLSPDTLGRGDGLEDYETGGVALSDASQGLMVATWRCRFLAGSNEIRIGKEPYSSETPILSASGVTEVSLAFDQNMRPAIAFMEVGQAKLYWYDPIVEEQVTTVLAADITSMFLTMDDKRAPATTLNINDILLFYVRGTSLYYRQQRDRFTIERFLTILMDPSARLRKAGMAVGLQVQIQVAYT